MQEKNFFGYMRVSSREQNEERQRLALLQAGVPEDNIYLDKLSGRDFNRPQYRALLRRLDGSAVLFVESIDRLGRSYADLTRQWGIITKQKGADIVVLDMLVLDTRRDKDLLGTFLSDVVLALLSYVAENERDSIRQRQAEGIAAAKLRGMHFGRPQKPETKGFEEAAKKWRQGELSLAQAAALCGMAKSTFYRHAKK